MRATQSRMMVGAVVVAGVSAGWSFAQTSSEPSETPASSAAPAATLAEDVPLEQWLQAAKPQIERLAGAKFAQDVRVQVVTADELSVIIAKPMRERLIASGANKRPDGSPMSDLEITARTRSAAYKIAGRTFGLYAYGDKTIYVVPQNAELTGKRRAWEPATVLRVARLAAAHELVHALQDQVADIGARMAKISGEPEKHLTAVIEGHAVVVTDALAGELGWETANRVLWGVVAGVQEETKPGDVPAYTQGAPEAVVYTVGASFMRAQAGVTDQPTVGPKRLWAIVQRPPEKWAEIAAPEAFMLPDDRAKPEKLKPGENGDGSKP